MKWIDKYRGIFAGVVTLLITMVLKQFPDSTGDIYSRFVFPLIRKIFDFVLFPIHFSLLLIFILWMVWRIIIIIRKREFINLLNLAGWLIAAFYWLWGFHYFDPPLSKTLDLPVVAIDAQQREALTEKTLNHAIGLSRLLEAPAPMPVSDVNRETDRACRSISSGISGTTAPGILPVAMFPKSLFLRIGITGMYFPYTGQAHYEPLLTPVSLPFTMAHEWFHAAGIAPESEANFLAYISLVNSGSNELIYAAQMNLLIELLIHYKLTEPEKYKFYRLRFTPKMDADLKMRNALFRQYSNVISQQSDVVINRYLKMQNQQGTVDYSRLAEWVVAWDSRK